MEKVKIHHIGGGDGVTDFRQMGTYASDVCTPGGPCYTPPQEVLEVLGVKRGDVVLLYTGNQSTWADSLEDFSKIFGTMVAEIKEMGANPILWTCSCCFLEEKRAGARSLGVVCMTTKELRPLREGRKEN